MLISTFEGHLLVFVMGIYVIFLWGFHSLGCLLLCILSVESSSDSLRDPLFLISFFISFVKGVSV